MIIQVFLNFVYFSGVPRLPRAILAGGAVVHAVGAPVLHAVGAQGGGGEVAHVAGGEVAHVVSDVDRLEVAQVGGGFEGKFVLFLY